jgi:hypothetical protein
MCILNVKGKRQGIRVNEYVWYSRLAVWVGCVILLAQAIAGRGASVMTVAGVILLSLGFVAFVGTLARSSLVTDSQTGSSTVSPPTRDSESGSGASSLDDSVGRTVAGKEEVVPTIITGVDETVTSSATSPVDQGIETVDVSETSAEFGSICPRCTLELKEGHISAACPLCGTTHHAACWIENHFRCSAPGCKGSGNLAAPRTA